MKCPKKYVDHVDKLILLVQTMLDLERKDAAKHPASYSESYIGHYEEFTRIKAALDMYPPYIPEGQEVDPMMLCHQTYVDHVEELTRLMQTMLVSEKEGADTYPALYGESYVGHYEEFIRIKVALDLNIPYDPEELGL